MCVPYPLESGKLRAEPPTHAARSDLTDSVDKVVRPKPIPAQICQLILYIGDKQGYIEEFVRELDVSKRRYKHFLQDKASRASFSSSLAFRKGYNLSRFMLFQALN